MSGEHHGREQEGRDLKKLRILLPHWIEHNEEHASGFRDWAAKSRELDLEETAQRIDEAVECMMACNKALSAAQETLE